MRPSARLPPTTAWGVTRRLLRWSRAGLFFAGRVVRDRLRGPVDASVLGGRLARLFEEVGGTAIKVGQQLAMRSDLLPPLVCDKLAHLTDRVPPMSWEQARAQVELSLGCPIEEVFAELGQRPIGSASVACVYKGVLRTGEAVAVKVKRPGIARQFAEDLAVFKIVTTLAEQLALVRDGFFKHLRSDLAIMFGEEMSFRQEALYQRRFRKEIKRIDMPWISAPRVYPRFSSDTIMISEFVEATPCSAVLAILESGDADAIAALKARDIDPSRIAHRLMLFSLWVRFEAPFFHADPHPGNVFVRPGDHIVLLDFGACGATSRRTRTNHMEVIRQMVRRDASMIAAVMLSDLSPLPLLDTDAFLGEIEKSFQNFVQAVEDDHSHWSERIVASVWLRLLEVARGYQVRINLDTVRSIRAFLLYDTLVFRMEPKLSSDVMREFLTGAAQRKMRAVLQQRAGLSAEDQAGAQAAGREQLIQRIEDMFWQLERAAESASATFQALASSAVEMSRLVARTLLFLSVLGLVFNLARLAHVEMTAQPGLGLAERPLLALVLALPLLLVLRRLFFAANQVRTD